MHTVELGEYLPRCPDWWQKMINHMGIEYPTENMGFSVESINTELKKLGNVEFIDDCAEYPNGAIIFKDNDAYVMCMLRWG